MCSPFPVADRISDEEFTRASKILKQYSHKWRTIGEGLGFKAIELDNIMSTPLLLFGAPISYLSTILSDWHQWTPGDHRGSSTYATLHSLRMALDKAGLGLTAQELITISGMYIALTIVKKEQLLFYVVPLLW